MSLHTYVIRLSFVFLEMHFFSPIACFFWVRTLLKKLFFPHFFCTQHISLQQGLNCYCLLLTSLHPVLPLFKIRPVFSQGSGNPTYQSCSRHVEHCFPFSDKAPLLRTLLLSPTCPHCTPDSRLCSPDSMAVCFC